MLEARIKHKRDTAVNWNTNNPVILDGELIIVETAEGRVRTKIGNGVSTYGELPFTDENIMEEVSLLASNMVDTSTVQTISGVKTFDSILTKSVFSDVINLDNPVSKIINISLGSCFTKTITSGTVFTITKPSEGKAACFTLVLTNAGSYTIGWPSYVKWANDEQPDYTKNGIDVLTFITVDGGNTWYGTPSILNAL